MLSALLTAVLLAQAPEAEPPAEPAAAPAEAVKAADPAQPAAPAPPAKPKAADDAAALMRKALQLPAAEQPKAIQDVRAKFTAAPVNPVLPPDEFDLEPWAHLAPADQAKVTARAFMGALLAANPKELVAMSGLPFLMEDRRLDRADELRAEWAKVLHGRRTDLLTLYDIEVLSPADMEKRFGKIPPRLSKWDLRVPNTSLAVCNLSGHAAVLLLRQVGLAWQVIGYHD